MDRNLIAERVNDLPSECVEQAETEASRLLAEHVKSWEAVEAKAARYLLTFGGASGALALVTAIEPPDNLLVAIPALIGLALAVASGGFAARALQIEKFPVASIESVLPARTVIVGGDGSVHPANYRRAIVQGRLDEATLVKARVERKARAQTWAERLFIAALALMTITAICSTTQEVLNARPEGRQAAGGQAAGSAPEGAAAAAARRDLSGPRPAARTRRQEGLRGPATGARHGR